MSTPEGEAPFCRRCGQTGHEGRDCPLNPAAGRSLTVTAVAAADAGARDVVVVAKNPQEMMAAQARMVHWATAKLAEEIADRDDLQRNLQLAIENGWAVKTLERQTDKADKRVVYYDKIKQALEAGFVIIPNMPSDVFAVRTTRRRPKANQRTVGGRREWDEPPGIDQMPSLAPAGAGEYRSPTTSDRVSKSLQSAKPDEGQRYAITRWADEFRSIDFPFATAKPEILSATAEALALKIFDDVAVSPRRQDSNLVQMGQRRVTGDPLVIGRVLLRKNAHDYQATCFLVTWFIDSRAL